MLKLKPLCLMRITLLLVLAVSRPPMAHSATARARRPDGPEPVVYKIRVPAPETHVAEIEAQIPTARLQKIELMLPVWSPGYYGVGDYAKNVREFTAETPDGTALKVDRPTPNHWVIATDGAAVVVIKYKLVCTSQFVTGSWVGTDFAIINGPSTFITLADRVIRPHEVHLELPSVWRQSISSLDPAPDGRPHHYIGPNYDVFIDSPIVAGTLSIHEFEIAGATFTLADFGNLGAWDGGATAESLKRIVAAHHDALDDWPFQRYVFLNAFRRGGGGLEHLNSCLLSSAPGPKNPLPTMRWLKYVSHEFYHAINVKRLRPIELGPFDYEKLPETPSLWIAEGLTTYFGDLAVVRSGVGSVEDYLGGLSSSIRSLQASPGRLVQTLEQSSRHAGSQGSGVGGDRNTTVSYYVKGPVVGLILDARIRSATNDRANLDDVMRLAYSRYSGARGFRADEFVAVVSEVAGTDLSEFMHRLIGTTEELDYAEALDWFGLRFASPGSPDPARAWALEQRPDATPESRQHLKRLVSGRSDTR